MRVTVNEREMDIADSTTLYALRDLVKPGADVLVLNGGPVREDVPLQSGDLIAFICRGETPSHDELEALMAARHTPGVHAILKRAAVGIAGLGGLGSAIAVALARIGVGKLILADFDVVEPSNLNRQQFFIDQIGKPKVEALIDNLARINPYVQTDGHIVELNAQNVPQIFGDVNVMVEAFDSAENKVMLVESFRSACPQIPLVVATGLAGYEPSNTIRTRRGGKNFYVVGDDVTAAGPGMGLMAPRVGVAAHHQANAVLRLLLGLSPET